MTLEGRGHPLICKRGVFKVKQGYQVEENVVKTMGELAELLEM